MDKKLLTKLEFSTLLFQEKVYRILEISYWKLDSKMFQQLPIKYTIYSYDKFFFKSCNTESIRKILNYSFKIS